MYIGMYVGIHSFHCSQAVCAACPPSCGIAACGSRGGRRGDDGSEPLAVDQRIEERGSVFCIFQTT